MDLAKGGQKQAAAEMKRALDIIVTKTRAVGIGALDRKMTGGASNELSMHCSPRRRWGMKTLNHLNWTKSIETLDGVESKPTYQKSLVFIMELPMTLSPYKYKSVTGGLSCW